jgi:ABC-type dipeptide/oligopeptide/nickel transport system permease subunit
MSTVDVETLGARGPADDEAVDAPDRDISGKSPTRIAFDRLKRDKVFLVSAAVIVLFAILGLFAPLITKLMGTNAGDAGALDITKTDTYGMSLVRPSLQHPFGYAPATAGGYDNFARWLYGARTSLGVAITASVVTVAIGIIVGLVAGMARGWLDAVITFVIDVFLCMPFLLVALAVAPILFQRFGNSESSFASASLVALLLILIFFTWMYMARLIRGEVLSLREREFIQAARVIGVPTRQILFKELLPNLVAPIVVSLSLLLPQLVTAEASLSYLGVGLTGIPSWGQTINSATSWFSADPWFLWQPLLALVLLVITLNLAGDSIRDAFDPRTRR